MLDKPSWNLFIKKLLIIQVNKALTFLKTAFFLSETFKHFLYLAKQHMDTKTFKVIYLQKNSLCHIFIIINQKLGKLF